jgi:hypothetical protein
MKLSNKNTINIEDFRVVDKDGHIAKVFTGRDRGQDVRKNSNLDAIESSNDEVIIIIPSNVYAINPSFFEELFLNAVLKLGRETFLTKFKFKSEAKFNYEKPLFEAIDRILRNKTAIG